jgi:hypothetical protein
MDQLSDYLSCPPVDVNYNFEELPAKLKNTISDVLEKQNDIISFFGLTLSGLRKNLRRVSRLFILCPPHNKIATMSKKECPNAYWGFSNGQVSATYDLDNKFIIWHEALHLLGAEDCYDLSKGDRGPNCECKKCIMQYEPTKYTVGEWPFLCDRNIDRIRKWVLE